MSTDIETVEIPRVRFTQRERRGVFLGRSWPQIILAGIAILGMLLPALLASWERVWWLLFLGLPLLVLAVWNFRGEPILLLLSQSSRYLWRSMRGQTKFRRNVWRRVLTTPLPTGNPSERIPVPYVYRHLDLPGGLADVQFVDIPTRGGFIYNARDQVAAVTIRIRSSAWMLRDDTRKAEVYNGFGGWLSSLEGMPALTEANLCVRVDRAPSTELAEHAARRDEERKTVISDELQREYDWLVATEQARSMEFTSTITLSFDVAALSTDVKDSGGGLTGLGAIMFDRVEALKSALVDLDVDFEEWMDAETLDAYTAAALDPMTASARREKLGRSRKESRSRPPMMSIDEHSSSITIDGTEHRTMWVHEWPRTKVRVGFLHPLLYTGESTRSVVLQFRPIPMHEAINELGQAQIDLEAAATVREKWGGRTGILHDREAQDLEDREEDLADGFTDGRFRAFVTISGHSLAEIRRDQTSLEQAGYQAHVRMGLLRNQQWPALVTSVLPIPTRGKKKK
ncbi:SCO6880 family protein [Microbacterium amylolyticum]|uniref:PrgI family protein n=1 Tax=Microbacterium amylolyticum TaxID=936337 RepID=A0ABS4ZKU5_9MICO|nr:SCO6880 family protein [Microbacterium amylolyticum]MBP2437904.1 hypothetical protein [Microbacterium amylolyticum]